MSPVLKRLKIGFIGAGNMTRSLIGGLSKNPEILKENLYVCSRSSEKAKNLAMKYDVQFTEHIDQVLENCDWVVLSMKPQDLPDFLDSYGKSIDENHKILSLCAGISLESLKRQLPQAASVARLMPSTAAEYGSGVLGVYTDDEILSEDIEDFFSSVGRVQIVENEELLDGIMISAASGIGFLLEVLQIWSEWLEEMGFEASQAEEITKMSFQGVSELIKKTDKSFSRLQSEVTSKKGVTLAGLEAMRSSDLDDALNKGFQAALRRSKELSEIIK